MGRTNLGFCLATESYLPLSTRMQSYPLTSTYLVLFVHDRNSQGGLQHLRWVQKGSQVILKASTAQRAPMPKDTQR